MKSWTWAPALLIVAMVVMQGCTPTEPPEPAEVTIPECEKNWNWDRYEQARLVNWPDLVRDSTTSLSGPRETQNTAEFHDCQRFVMEPEISQSETFSDGIFTIFAVPKADPVDPYVSDPVYAEAAALGLALPAAEIFARAEYEPLGIGEGFSCVYLYPTVSGDFAARLRYDGWDEENCSDPMLISDLGSAFPWRTLEVDRSRIDGPPDPLDYPVVTRWIWHYDEQTDFQEYKMGVWCDQAWCEVGGPAARAPTPSFAAGKGVPPDIADTKQFKVNGWFDEQILAGYNGSLFVSGIVGTVIPARNLGEYDEDTFAEGRWVPTARVALTPLQDHSSPANPFEQKLNLGMSRNHGVGLNQVFLCRGPWQDASGASVCQEDGLTEPQGLGPEQIHRDTFQWWGKVVRRGGGPPVTEYFSVARCPYNFDVAGAARWRWLSEDPGIWMRCINGCCELDGKH